MAAKASGCRSSASSSTPLSCRSAPARPSGGSASRSFALLAGALWWPAGSSMLPGPLSSPSSSPLTGKSCSRDATASAAPHDGAARQVRHPAQLEWQTAP